MKKQQNGVAGLTGGRWTSPNGAIRLLRTPVSLARFPQFFFGAPLARPYRASGRRAVVVGMGRETSSLRSHPYNVLASPLCHSSHQSTPSGVGRFPSRNVATVENSRYASRKLERAKDSIRKARSPRASAAVISRWRRVNAQTWCLRHPHIIHTHHDVLARRRRLRIAANRVAIRAPEACHPRHFAIIAGLRDSR